MDEYAQALIEAVNMAYEDPKLMEMITQWNTEKDGGVQDMITSKILRNVHDVKEAAKPVQ